MDTFMDKLAQKLTAQEMIRANSAAETEEMELLKEQVKEYKECLDRLEQLLEGNLDKYQSVQVDSSSIERLVEDGVAKFEQSAENIERVTDVSLARLSRIEQNDELQIKMQLVSDRVAELTNLQDENLADLGTVLEKKIMQVPFMMEDKLAEIPNTLVRKLDEKLEEKFNQNDEASKQQSEVKMIELSESIHRECVKVYRNVQAVIVEENAKLEEHVMDAVNQVNASLNKVFRIAVAAVAVAGAGVVLQLLSAFNFI